MLLAPMEPSQRHKGVVAPAFYQFSCVGESPGSCFCCVWLMHEACARAGGMISVRPSGLFPSEGTCICLWRETTRRHDKLTPKCETHGRGGHPVELSTVVQTRGKWLLRSGHGEIPGGVGFELGLCKGPGAFIGLEEGILPGRKSRTEIATGPSSRMR